MEGERQRQPFHQQSLLEYFEIAAKVLWIGVSGDISCERSNQYHEFDGRLGDLETSP